MKQLIFFIDGDNIECGVFFFIIGVNILVILFWKECFFFLKFYEFESYENIVVVY